MYWFIASAIAGLVAVALGVWFWRCWKARFDDSDAETRAKRIAWAAGLSAAIAMAFVGAGFALRSTTTPPGPQPSSATTGGGGQFLSVPIGNFIRTFYPRRSSPALPRNTRIVLVFTKPIKEETLLNGTSVRPDAFTLNVVDNAKSLLVPVGLKTELSRDRTVVVFTPTALLGKADAETRYTAIVGLGLRSETNEYIVSPEFQWEFMVGTTEDRTPPTLSGRFPDSGSVVSKNGMHQLTFSEPIDPLTLLEGGGINLEQSGVASTQSVVAVTRSVSDDLKTVELSGTTACGANACGQPMRCFSESASWTTRVKDVRDLAGNVLGDPIEYEWKTGSTVETMTPAVVVVTPKVNASGVALDAPIRVTFSGIMSTTAVTASSVVLPTSWWEFSFSRDRKASTLIVAHPPFSQETVPVAPFVTSEFTNIYQQCFQPCLGP